MGTFNRGTTGDAGDGRYRPGSVIGRPVATSHAAIEAAAFRLFEANGFQNTTMGAIAAELGIGRRTLFRYFESKNDIPWGQFADSLDSFRVLLEQMPASLPLHEAVHRGVIAFNDFDEAAVPSHRERMRLILETPALQAHSVLRYAEWRQVIAGVRRRRAPARTRALPCLASSGSVSLALALSAYETWLEHEGANLLNLIDEAMDLLRATCAPEQASCFTRVAKPCGHKVS